jgi:hypothetical protein
MRRFLAVAGAVAALCGGVVGGASAIVGGTPDAGHPYAGGVFSAHELCSGFFVSAHDFVTAAHCFPDGSQVQITFGQITHPGAVFTTSAPTFTGTVHDDPLFCFGCGHGLPNADTHDLAVVVIDGAGAPGPYAQLPALGTADRLPNHQVVDVVGYGATVLDKGTPVSFGSRHVASTSLVSAGALAPEFLKLLGSPGDCLGDSGGPVLLGGTDTVLGLASFGHSNPNCNGVTFAERLDTAVAQAFIASFS